VFVHSLTKYAAGTGDVMGGAVMANKDVMQLIRPDWRLLGAQLDPHAAFLLMRGMRTYFLRYRAQSAAALEIARWLAQRPEVSRVHYPGLETHPRAALARTQMREFGTIVSFDIRGGLDAGRSFVERLELFAMTASLGSTESLAWPPQMMQGRDFTPEQRRLSGVSEGSVRLSIGLESVEDLLADLQQALSGAAEAPRA
jgi:cystathionine beta-lyase/cystathionine gamma-synthase